MLRSATFVELEWGRTNTAARNYTLTARTEAGTAIVLWVLTGDLPLEVDWIVTGPDGPPPSGPEAHRTWPAGAVEAALVESEGMDPLTATLAVATLRGALQSLAAQLEAVALIEHKRLYVEANEAWARVQASAPTRIEF